MMLGAGLFVFGLCIGLYAACLALDFGGGVLLDCLHAVLYS